MSKKVKKVLIIITIILSIILLDSIQALILNNSSFLKIRTYYVDSPINYIDNGLLVDTYQCLNGKKDTVIKGFSYTCTTIDDFIIVDTTKEIKDFACAEALEEIYEDENYTYYLSCIKSEYIEVRYSDARKESVTEALQSGNINIEDLDKFNITYYKYEKK